MPAVADPTFKQAELGMKLTCGFEMMYWERQRFETDDILMSDGMSNLFHSQFYTLYSRFEPLHVLWS
jgi:hypothetical protein